MSVAQQMKHKKTFWRWNIYTGTEIKSTTWNSWTSPLTKAHHKTTKLQLACMQNVY